MIGKTVSHYRIVEKLGQGGMGEVFLAHDTSLDRKVALKFLPDIFSGDPERLARFEREARALAALSHPNILAIFDFGTEAGVTYAVTELLEGETLRQRLEHERLPWRRSVEIASAVADGLSAAHGKGIIHRDIKPENIFITTDGRVKVLDFGLARLEHVSRADEGATTVTDPGTVAGTVLGTVGYMAPEQVRGQAADARSDIFTLGCLLYEMLAGKRAFARDTAAETMTAILKEPAPEVSVSGVEVTPELNRIVAHCLEKNPGERFQSASDLAFNLKNLLTGAASAKAGGMKSDVGAGPETPSIVVLPFDDISPGRDNEYFADGLTEEIIADLSGVKNLRVISRTSAMRLKGTGKDLQTIATDLKVRYVLEGSVRKAGNSLRITAQLIEAASEAHLWANKYSGTLDNIFEIQEEVSRAIVAALKMALAPDEERRIAEHPLSSGPAYDCYLRARQEIGRWTEPALDRALRQLETAIELVGENSFLLAGMAEVYASYIGGGFRNDEMTARKTEEYGRRAIVLDPKLVSGHYALGVLAGMRGEPKQMYVHMKRAVALDPTDANSMYWFEMAAGAVGRSREIRPLVARLLETDPLNYMSRLIAAAADYFEGNFEAALAPARAALRLDPGSVMVRYWCTVVFAATRQFQEAHALLDQWRSDTPEHPYLLALTAWLHAVEGRRSESSELLATILSDENLRALMRADYMGVWVGAETYALNGDTGEALSWLQHGMDMGAINYPFLATLDPWFENLRGDPHFEKLMQRVKREWEEFEA